MTAAIAAVALFASCGDKNGNSADGTPTTSDSLKVALANQDSLLTILNDITDGMNQIKEMENLLNSGGLGAETPDQRQQIREDMIQIQQSLQQRRERLEQLEKQLAASNQNNAKLQRAIKSLKEQIANQESTIEGLRSQLADANIQIEGLNQSVNRLGQEKDSLNTVVASESTARQDAERRATEVNNELNTCYYAIGTGKELKAHNLMQSGFLRSTKVLPQNFDQSYFTKGDKRELRTISLGSKKAKVLTNQPADSYEIVETANGMKVLKITNASRFWNQSNFLVVKTD
jgi:chromosome segregation ATPase